MEWVETTGKSLDEAKEAALDRLGIGPDDAEFEVIEEPRTGLFGRIRGEARVRARVKPATVRPKHDRRNRRKSDSKSSGERADDGSAPADDSPPSQDVTGSPASTDGSKGRRGGGARQVSTSGPGVSGSAVAGGTAQSISESEGSAMTDRDIITDDDGYGQAVDVGAVQRAAEEFSAGLLSAFGLAGTATSSAAGVEIDVRIDGQGDGLGLLIGPGGRTLLAIQDLARVAAQRRLGDHETRLRVDIAGYREKRRIALERFAQHVADLVKESGVARSLDPMPSADRKVVHDTLAGIEGVATRSEGEDPYRRIIVTPA